MALKVKEINRMHAFEMWKIQMIDQRETNHLWHHQYLT